MNLSPDHKADLKKSGLSDEFIEKAGPLLAKYKNRLASLPPPGSGGCHVALLGVANLGTIAGLDPDEIFHGLRAAIPQGQRRVSDQEIQAAIHKATTDHKGEPYRRYRSSKAGPVIKDGKSALQAIIKQSKIYGEADLWESSPIRLDWEPQDDAQNFLFALFNPDDLIFIGERYEPGILGKTIRPAAVWIKHCGGKAGPHILINPLNGLPVEKKTNDGSTFRGDGNVSTYRYCLVEFDNLNREDQIKFWAAVKLPIVALVDSGNKSVHAWLDVQKLAAVGDAEQWQANIKQRLYNQILTPMGVDGACSNPSRLSRLPGHYREEKEKYQRLMWLSAEGRPIC